MKNRVGRRIEITIETHETKIIHIRTSEKSAFCQQCQASTTWFTPEQIALLLNISIGEVCRDMETGRFHLTETKRGMAMICGDSLTTLFKK